MKLTLFNQPNEAERYCLYCGTKFKATNAWHKYCHSNCKDKQFRRRRGLVTEVGRYCKQCGIKFIPPTPSAQHCTNECSVKSARQSRSKFFKNNPGVTKKYHANAVEKHGKDGNLKRLMKRYPDLSKSCESCGESRVLDIAHKPEFKRNGEWRKVSNTTPEKIWILCPTCHALIDRKGYNPHELGLK